jgi:YrbI family 3-deoxy-D-manno-octulosonate 8-phosphate phosphatase
MTARDSKRGTRTGPTALEKAIRSTRLVVFDFDGVFTDNSVYVFEDGREAVRCSRGDGLGLRKLQRLDIAAMILSTETNSVVSARSRKLGVAVRQGCTDKLADLERLAVERSLELREVAYVGNDINDLECLRAVGLPIVVRDAHPDVARFGLYRTARRGGEGAVREVCDLFESILSASGGK